MKYVILMVLVANIGCSSLPKKVMGLHKGDSATKVVDKLGIPESFKPNHAVASYDNWFYEEKDQTCVIVLKDDVVTRTMCGLKD